MEMQFRRTGARACVTGVEGGMLDIVVRLDDAGFIIHASQNASVLGIDLSALLLMPHICDLVDPDYADQIDDLFNRTSAGEHVGKWVDVPLITPPDANEATDAISTTGRQWFAIWLEPIAEDDGAGQGCIGFLRSVQARYAMVDEIEALASTDAMTGLANRPAFCGNLARVLIRETDQAGSAVAIFAIDRMRAIFMQYGQQTTDEIRWGFSRFLETMTHAQQPLALLDEERFAVLLPGMSLKSARLWADHVLRTFAELTAGPSSKAVELTASAGVAKVENSVDWTLRQAEMGLVMARAGGGMRASVCKPAPRIANGARMEQAIKAAVQRAEQRMQ